MKRCKVPFLITVILGLLLDLWSKTWAFDNYTFIQQEWLLGTDWLSFQLAYNKGAVWGILQGQVDLLSLASLLAIGFMLYMLIQENNPTIFFQILIGLIVAGALGNLHDRLVHEQVRDFIVVWLGNYRWPTFNAADAFICIGVTLFLLRELIYGASPNKTGTEAPTDKREGGAKA